MRSFDFYEFVGVIVPGCALIAGVVFCLPQESTRVLGTGLSVGDTSFAVILAYGLGHLIQAIGNGIESLWWRIAGGMPTDWLRSGRHHLLSDIQIRVLRQQVEMDLHSALPENFATMTRRDWHGIVRQIYAAVSGAGRASRIDIFNGNYGLLRGLAASLLTIIIAATVLIHPAPWRDLALLAVGFGVGVYRMHRFGVHYARELFVQYLALNTTFPKPTNDGEKHAQKEHSAGPNLAC